MPKSGGVKEDFLGKTVRTHTFCEGAPSIPASALCGAALLWGEAVAPPTGLAGGR